MKCRRRNYLLLFFLLFFIVACQPQQDVEKASSEGKKTEAPSAKAKSQTGDGVEWQNLETLDLDHQPLDIVTTPRGRDVFILTRGEVLVYSNSSKSIKGRIPVDMGVDRIAVSPRGDQLFLTNEKTKTFSVVSVAFIQNIDVKGAPFKGPENAPVVVAVFDDYQ